MLSTLLIFASILTNLAIIFRHPATVVHTSHWGAKADFFQGLALERWGTLTSLVPWAAHRMTDIVEDGCPDSERNCVHTKWNSDGVVSDFAFCERHRGRHTSCNVRVVDSSSGRRPCEAIQNSGGLTSQLFNRSDAALRDATSSHLSLSLFCIRKPRNCSCPEQRQEPFSGTGICNDLNVHPSAEGMQIRKNTLLRQSALRSHMLSRPSSSKSHATSTCTPSIRSVRSFGVALALLLATMLPTAMAIINAGAVLLKPCGVLEMEASWVDSPKNGS